MSTANFRVEKHIIPAQHIRQYAHATAGDQEDVLKVAINQYSPLDNLEPRPGDITIIAAHANGVQKEFYEPLWDDLLAACRTDGRFRIRSIWMADITSQGESGVLNEGKLGNDPSWFDHPRDLLHLINHFRDKMPRPLIGMGHSMGGNNIAHLSLLHPRLFTSVIFLEAMIKKGDESVASSGPTYASTFRRDLWSSRKEAATSFRRNPFFASWDSRAWERFVQYGFRDLPTLIYPESKSSTGGETPVTLTTSKHQEVFSFLRSTHPSKDEDLSVMRATKREFPDLLEDEITNPFYRPEVLMTYRNLPYLRPRCIWLFGGTGSFAGHPDILARVQNTGIGVGGNGGEREGAVKLNVLDGGHFIPFEKPRIVAEAIAEYLGPELELWRKEEDAERKAWDKFSVVEKNKVSEDRAYWTKKTMPGAQKSSSKL